MMNKLVVGLLIISVYSTGITYSQELPKGNNLDTKDEKLLTRIGQFFSRQGMVLERTIYKIGEVDCKGAGKFIIKVSEIASCDSNSSVKIWGVHFELKSIWDSGYIMTTATFLDYEDIIPLIKALKIIESRSRELVNINIEYKEILYTATNGIKFVVVQEGNKQKGGIIYMGEKVTFGMNRFPEISTYLEEAKNKIKLLMQH